MEIKKLKETTNQLEIEIKGENETLLNPIVQELIKDKEVEYASIETDHPNAPYRRLYIRLNKGSKSKPKKILENAIKQVDKVTQEFKKEMEKMLPSQKK